LIIDDVGGTKASEPSGEGDKGFDDVDGGGGDYSVDVVDGGGGEGRGAQRRHQDGEGA